MVLAAQILHLEFQGCSVNVFGTATVRGVGDMTKGGQ